MFNLNFFIKNKSYYTRKSPLVIRFLFVWTIRYILCDYKTRLFLEGKWLYDLKGGRGAKYYRNKILGTNIIGKRRKRGKNEYLILIFEVFFINQYALRFNPYDKKMNCPLTICSMYIIQIRIKINKYLFSGMIFSTPKGTATRRTWSSKSRSRRRRSARSWPCWTRAWGCPWRSTTAGTQPTTQTQIRDPPNHLRSHQNGETILLANQGPSLSLSGRAGKRRPMPTPS